MNRLVLSSVLDPGCLARAEPRTSIGCNTACGRADRVATDRRPMDFALCLVSSSSSSSGWPHEQLGNVSEDADREQSSGDALDDACLSS